jgi:hypothetical protein
MINFSVQLQNFTELPKPECHQQYKITACKSICKFPSGGLKAKPTTAPHDPSKSTGKSVPRSNLER